MASTVSGKLRQNSQKQSGVAFSARNHVVLPAELPVWRFFQPIALLRFACKLRLHLRLAAIEYRGINSNTVENQLARLMFIPFGSVMRA